MKKLLSLFVVLAFLTIGATSLFSLVQVGEEVAELIETSHPYAGGQGVVYQTELHWPAASYISVHFSNFTLGVGDYLVISNPDGSIAYTYEAKGKVVRGGKATLQAFWATHIPGDTAIVKLISKNPKGGWGIAIDKWVHGYEAARIESAMKSIEDEEIAIVESVCSSDDMEWAKCYEGTTMYDKARAICRLLINGSSACTGWLLGSEGHVMTNNHCIDSQSDADNTDFEFMAEGATCTTSCASWLGCPGIVEETSGTLVITDSALDYSLVLLPANHTGTYGFLQFRDVLPSLDERIYIPQHPSAWGKRLAVLSDTDGPYAKIYSTNEAPCSGGPGDIGYYADTAGGSSGSPVLGYDDNLVVALHHCAACPNRGVPIPAIISDLGGAIPANAIGGAQVDPPAAPTGLSANAVACDQVNLAWSDNASDESGFKIERSTDGSNFTQIGTVGANVTSFSDTNAAGDTSYWYRVAAYNGGGNSGYSNVASETTPVCPPSPPAAPSNLSAVAIRGGANLTWTDNANNETGFRVYRGTTSSNLVLVATLGANTTAYSDSGLTRKVYYYYKVCAYNANGEACSSIISVRTK